MTAERTETPGDRGTLPVLAHMVAGDGPPVLLLNGGLMSMSAWEPVAARLQPDFRVVRCDLRGQLLSPGPGPVSLREQADEVVRLLDCLEIPQAHVVGTSFGAIVGLVFAAAYAARVRSIVTITATDRFTPEMTATTHVVREACRAALRSGDGAAVFDLFAATTFSPEYREHHAAELALRRQLIGALPRTWFAGLDGLLGSLVDLDLRPLLPSVTARTLVLAGGRDETFPLEHSQALAAALPNATLRIVPHGAHALVLEHVDTVVDAIAGFIRS